MKHSQVAQRLIYQRKLKGLSQEQLADSTNITVRTIQRIEKGEVNPHLRTLKLLAAVLEIEVLDLLPLETPAHEKQGPQPAWLLLIHVAPFIGIIVPLNVIAPLLVWAYKRGDNPAYDYHGRAVINFQLTVSIFFVLAFVALVTIQGYGFFLFITVIPLAVAVMLLNIIAVISNRELYYPAFPFLKEPHASSASRDQGR